MKDNQRKAMWANNKNVRSSQGHGLRSSDMHTSSLTHDQFVKKASTYFQTHDIKEEEARFVADKMAERLFKK